MIYLGSVCVLITSYTNNSTISDYTYIFIALRNCFSPRIRTGDHTHTRFYTRANALGVLYTKHLVKNLHTTFTDQIISLNKYATTVNIRLSCGDVTVHSSTLPQVVSQFQSRVREKQSKGDYYMMSSSIGQNRVRGGGFGGSLVSHVGDESLSTAHLDQFILGNCWLYMSSQIRSGIGGR